VISVPFSSQQNHVPRLPCPVSRKIPAAARILSCGMKKYGFWHDFYQKSRQNPRPCVMFHLPGVITPATTNTAFLRDLAEYSISILLPPMRPSGTLLRSALLISPSRFNDLTIARFNRNTTFPVLRATFPENPPVTGHPSISFFPDLGFGILSFRANVRNFIPIKSNMEILSRSKFGTGRRSLRRFLRNDIINSITLFIVH